MNIEFVLDERSWKVIRLLIMETKPGVDYFYRVGPDWPEGYAAWEPIHSVDIGEASFPRYRVEVVVRCTEGSETWNVVWFTETVELDQLESKFRELLDFWMKSPEEK